MAKKDLHIRVKPLLFASLKKEAIDRGCTATAIIEEALQDIHMKRLRGARKRFERENKLESGDAK